MYYLAYLAQQESYQVTGYTRHHLRKTWALPEGIVWLAFLFAAVAAWLRLTAAVAVLGGVVFIVGAWTFLRWQRQKSSLKKPLVWTARAKRLGGAYVVIGLAEMALFHRLQIPVLLTAALSTANMLAALVATKPIEWAIQRRYKRKAHDRIAQLKQLHQLRVVGITGSYGKTSCKFILGTILGARHDVLVTPSSYNTPMGICKVVNGELASHHEVFVCEMGARHRGDIKELVELVEPTHAMITAVGPAHLETFGSIENIARTKFDLARGTSPDGVVVVNGDNEHCVQEAATLNREVLFYGLSAAPHLSAYAKDIRVENLETAFTLVLPGDGEVECRTRLLGRHNVLNIVGASLLARRMGLSLAEIAEGIRRIQPVEHRLQLIDSGNGILVIDDAFNSNPAGAEMALEVLSEFKDRRKWIVTPGMVELGAKSEAIHRDFGRKMAAVCDEVVLIGRLNSESMRQGLLEAGFPEDKIHVRTTLADWMKEAPRHWRPGDVILFENDFGDHLETLT
jgi:UDP-N-acetylmuramoyl-tripeptide--D-alanyl-D-alanine ligase